MILKNYINISIKNIVRNKKNTLKIFSITLFSFILFILTTSLSGSLNDFIKNYILNTIEHRTIMIDYSSVQNINIENKKETIPSLIGIVLGLLLQYFIWFYFYTLDIFIFYI